MDYNFYNSIQKKKHFVSPRVPNNLRFLLLPPRNSRATSSNVSTNVIVDRPIKSLVRPRDLHCGQATRKRVRHKQGLRITIGNARVVVNASRSASRRSFLFSFPPRFLSLSSLLLFDFSLLERRERERERLSLDSWVATRNNYCGGRREEKVANDRSTISDSPPFISCFLEVFITWTGGKEHNFAFKYPVVVLCTDPLDQIWKRERDFFFSRRDP